MIELQVEKNNYTITSSTYYGTNQKGTYNLNTGVWLPKQVRYIDANNVILSIEPRKWELPEKDHYTKKTRLVDIPLPWVIFVHQSRCDYLGFSPTEPNGLDVPVYYPYLSNVHKNLTPCWSTAQPNPEVSPQGAIDTLANFMDGYFNGGMYLNDGIYGVESSYMPPQVSKHIEPKGGLWINNTKLFNWLSRQSVKTVLSFDYVKKCEIKDLIEANSENLEWKLLRNLDKRH